MSDRDTPRLLVLNQMAGPMTWELVQDFASRVGTVALLTGHPDTLAKPAVEGVTVEAAPPYERGSYPRRILSWLRYLARSFAWSRRWPKEIPVLVFSNPPIAPWLAYLLKRLFGRPYLVVVHDVYPDLLTGLGTVREGHPLVRTWSALNRPAYENALLVATIGDYMAERLRKQFDPRRTAAGQIAVVSPWADTDVIRPLAKEENEFARKHGLLGKTTIMYSGNMGLGHDIETVLEAAARLRHREDLHFMFIGSGPKRKQVEQALEGAGSENLTLLDWQPENVLPRSLPAADLAVVSLEQGIEGISIPSKAFSFFAAGVPLLLLSRPNTELAAIIEEHRCGWIVPPGAVEVLVDLLASLGHEPDVLAERKRNSRKVGERFGSRANSVKLVELIRTCMGP